MSEFIRRSLSGGILGVALWGAFGGDRDLAPLIAPPSIIITALIVWQFTGGTDE